MDFDKKSWRADSWSVCEILKELNLPVARERSRSGNGAHLWFFFEEPHPARFVREVLTFVLSLAMERNPQIGLDSFDRIFPNQDRLPKGGFGNLIALPLQGGPRRVGNSCFVDECHAVSAPSFEKVLKASSAKYVLGLSATLVRKDGHHPIIEMQCGPVRYRVDAKKMGNYSAFRHVVRVRPTPFVPESAQLESEGRAVFADAVQEAMANNARNALIVSDVLESVAEGRSPVVLSERREHLEILEKLLAGKVAHLVLMRGGMGRKEMNSVRAELDAVPSGEARVLLATGSYLGEGFDDARLDTLFLTLPISWKGRLIQYAGRLHRLCNGKKEVRIYDYVDMRVQMCRTMFNKRCAGYRSIGYEITMPDDRLKGWPEEARLPVVLRENGVDFLENRVPCGIAETLDRRALQSKRA